MGKRSEQIQIEENRDDRLSDLPDSVLLHIFSFLNNTREVVQTCILSTRWKHLWKSSLHNLTLYNDDDTHFSSNNTLDSRFAKFVAGVLSRRDFSLPLHALDHDSLQPCLLKKIVGYAISHRVQQLTISVGSRSYQHILPHIFSCQTLTSLSLFCNDNFRQGESVVLFPNTLYLPSLTSLELHRFVFDAGEEEDGGRVEPFSACNRLNDLILHKCATVRNEQTLCISSTTLVNFTIYDKYPRNNDVLLFNHESTRRRRRKFKIELSAPSLRSFAFEGLPFFKLCGSNLSSIKQVIIEAYPGSKPDDTPTMLLGWLIELADIESLTISSSTLKALSLAPDLLKVKLPFLLCNLKLLKVKSDPYWCIHDGVVDCLLQNAPLATTSYIDYGAGV